MSYGIIHWGSSHHIQPIKVLQNKLCRGVLNLEARTSETEIYRKMKVSKLEKLYKKRVLLFVFRNKNEFNIKESVSITRTGGGMVATYQDWVKHHSRLQLGYRGCEIFNTLPRECRSEGRLPAFKKKMTDFCEEPA